MKVAISQPMKGKSVEQLEQERADLVKLLSEKGYIVENTVFTFSDRLSENRFVLFCLGKGLNRVISLIAAMDAVVFTDGWEEVRGCRLEHDCCEAYDIPILYARDL